MSFHSQFGEDAFIADKLAKYLPAVGGYFCEVGAFDGVTSSNTLHFEESGWRGVCIEPMPEAAAACRKNRKAVTWCCACGPSGLKPFFWNPQDLGAGGLERNGIPFPVVVCGLEELVLASGFQNIDLLSIDTEGTELDVWRTRGRLSPRVVIIEFWSQPKPPAPGPVIDLLEADGYLKVHQTTANLIFLRLDKKSGQA